jgi:peptide/nickel transport system permease protein
VRLVLLLFGVSLFSFFLVVSSPIDPVSSFISAESGASEEQRALVAAYWGLDQGPLERYGIWLNNVLHGNLGTSMLFRRPVAAVLAERALASLALMLTAWVFSGILGFILGVICGAKPNSMVDKGVGALCFVLSSTPVFWVGLLFLVIFAVNLGWFPIGFAAPIGKAAAEVRFGERVHHLILPALTLSITGISGIVLHTRQKLIDVLNSEYILFARARGESLWTAVRRHGLRNIALPALTLQFASFSELFGGSVLAENVFSYPGLGSAASQAGIRGDAQLLLGVALFSVFFVFIGNVIANLLYGVLDPRIRAGSKRP